MEVVQSCAPPETFDDIDGFDSPIIPEGSDLSCQSIIIRTNHPAVASSPQNLCRVKAENACIPEGGTSPVLKLCPQGLRSILNHLKVMRLSDLHDFVHIAGMAIEMDRDNPFCLGCNSGLYLVHINIKIVCHVYQDRGRPTLHDGPYGSHKSMSHRNDFVTGSESKGTRRQIEGIRTRIDSNRIFRPHIFGDPFLELLYMPSQNKNTTH